MPTGLPQPGAAETTLHQYDAGRWYPRHAEIIDRLEAIKASNDNIVAAIQAAQTAIVNAVQDTTGAIPDLAAIETALATLLTAQQDTTGAIPDLAAIETALSDLLTAQQDTTGAIPDLAAIETALATLLTAQQATTAAVENNLDTTGGLGVMLAHALGLRNDSTSAAAISEFLPATGAALQAAEAADTGNKLEELSRLAREQDLLDLRGQFPDSWFGLVAGDHITLKDLLQAATGASIDDSGTEKSLFENIADIVDFTSDSVDLFSDLGGIVGDVAGKISGNSIGGVNALVALANTIMLGSIANNLQNLSAALTGRTYKLTAGAPVDYTLEQITGASAYHNQDAFTTWKDLIAALRGGSQPNDSILQALRGDVQASAGRNVIDAVNGLTLSADNITIDVTTLETRLDSLIDQVERLRGVTPDSAAANVDDVFQELDDLRGDVATLISTTDESSFMQIVDVVESINKASKELVGFHTSFLSADFCCIDASVISAGPPDDIIAPQSDHCQRVQWYIDAASNFLSQLVDFPTVGAGVGAGKAPVVRHYYQLYFGVEATYIQSVALGTYIDTLRLAGGLSELISQYAYIRGVSIALDADGSPIASTPGLLCALYNATSAKKAQSSISTLLEAYYGELPSGVVPRSASAAAHYLLLWLMGSTTSLDPLFAGTIPTDPADLAGYDNTACSGCSTGGGGDCSFIAAGTSVDIGSSGPYNFLGKSRTIIEWPAGWPANENDDNAIGAPTSRYILDDSCLPGLELTRLSAAPIAVSRYFDDGTRSSIQISATGIILPPGVERIAVYRGGPGVHAGSDEPFTLRVTRPS